VALAVRVHSRLLRDSADGLADDDGDGTVLVVARVRLPVALIFDVIRTLNDTMTEYEREFGEIRPPESREEES
jgi:hypothetical protein